MWHVERGIPVAVIIALFFQTIGLVWYFSGEQTKSNMRLDALEKNYSASAWQAEKIIRIDEKLNAVQTSLSKIENMAGSTSPSHLNGQGARITR